MKKVNLSSRKITVPVYWLVSTCVFSAMLGYATTIIPRTVTHYASSILFAVFGLKMLKDGKWTIYEEYLYICKNEKLIGSKNSNDTINLV